MFFYAPSATAGCGQAGLGCHVSQNGTSWGGEKPVDKSVDGWLPQSAKGQRILLMGGSRVQRFFSGTAEKCPDRAESDEFSRDIFLTNRIDDSAGMTISDQ
jgi:hypothetical protein